MSNVGGFWIRLVAILLDGLLIGAVVTIGLSLGLDPQSQAVQLGEGLLALAYVIVVPALWFGYTVGKRIVGIRVVKKDHSDVSFGTMVMREFVAGLVYGFTFGIAIIVSIFMVTLRQDKRAIHDFIAGTYVTHNKPSS
ncbi:Uncharacterized membrane protein YckC, RDD family [Natribacillus halophilus]|uniref:Uncharacterized membrane protein YckC, RDD family n=1 Tax=Natribacillus halophilus TaxID=549003 RepID=A0A1G8PI24_9BACI|nr:Uncharacterized membrane protein YckC, RDD family [Natribacillus halophilus]